MWSAVTLLISELNWAVRQLTSVREILGVKQAKQQHCKKQQQQKPRTPIWSPKCSMLCVKLIDSTTTKEFIFLYIMFCVETQTKDLETLYPFRKKKSFIKFFFC